MDTKPVDWTSKANAVSFRLPSLKLEERGQEPPDAGVTRVFTKDGSAYIVDADGEALDSKIAALRKTCGVPSSRSTEVGRSRPKTTRGQILNSARMHSEPSSKDSSPEKHRPVPMSARARLVSVPKGENDTPRRQPPARNPLEIGGTEIPNELWSQPSAFFPGARPSVSTKAPPPSSHPEGDSSPQSRKDASAVKDAGAPQKAVPEKAALPPRSVAAPKPQLPVIRPSRTAQPAASFDDEPLIGSKVEMVENRPEPKRPSQMPTSTSTFPSKQQAIASPRKPGTQRAASLTKRQIMESLKKSADPSASLSTTVGSRRSEKKSTPHKPSVATKRTPGSSAARTTKSTTSTRKVVATATTAAPEAVEEESSEDEEERELEEMKQRRGEGLKEAFRLADRHGIVSRSSSNLSPRLPAVTAKAPAPPTQPKDNEESPEKKRSPPNVHVRRTTARLSSEFDIVKRTALGMSYFDHLGASGAEVGAFINKRQKTHKRLAKESAPAQPAQPESASGGGNPPKYTPAAYISPEKEKQAKASPHTRRESDTVPPLDFSSDTGSVGSATTRSRRSSTTAAATAGHRGFRYHYDAGNARWIRQPVDDVVINFDVPVHCGQKMTLFECRFRDHYTNQWCYAVAKEYLINDLDSKGTISLPHSPETTGNDKPTPLQASNDRAKASFASLSELPNDVVGEPEVVHRLVYFEHAKASSLLGLWRAAYHEQVLQVHVPKAERIRDLRKKRATPLARRPSEKHAVQQARLDNLLLQSLQSSDDSPSDTATDAPITRRQQLEQRLLARLSMGNLQQEGDDALSEAEMDEAMEIVKLLQIPAVAEMDVLEIPSLPFRPLFCIQRHVSEPSDPPKPEDVKSSGGEPEEKAVEGDGEKAQEKDTDSGAENGAETLADSLLSDTHNMLRFRKFIHEHTDASWILSHCWKRGDSIVDSTLYSKDGTLHTGDRGSTGIQTWLERIEAANCKYLPLVKGEPEPIKEAHLPEHITRGRHLWKKVAGMCYDILAKRRQIRRVSKDNIVSSRLMFLLKKRESEMTLAKGIRMLNSEIRTYTASTTNALEKFHEGESSFDTGVRQLDSKLDLIRKHVEIERKKIAEWEASREKTEQ